MSDKLLLHYFLLLKLFVDFLVWKQQIVRPGADWLRVTFFRVPVVFAF
jgi:hypothetical protein